MDDARLLESPIRFLPPGGTTAEWPPVEEWTDAEWTQWMREHNKYPFLHQFADDEIRQYLQTDRQRYGIHFQRDKTEPRWWFYRPTPIAVQFHAARERNILFGGAAGGSKSHSARFDAYRHCLTIPGFRAIVMRRTFEELQRNHLDKVRSEASTVNAYFGMKVFDYNETRHELTIRGIHAEGKESRILFGHCQNVGDEEKYLGDEYHAFYPDEMATFVRKQIIGVQGRLRSTLRWSDGTHRYHVRPRSGGTSNPGGAQTLWLRDEYIDRNVSKVRELNPRYKAEEHVFIQAMLYDNPYYMDPDGTYTDYEDRLFAYDPERRRQLLLGDWNALTGQFFPEFSTSRHVAELPIPPGSKLERWIDWGYAPHYGVCLWVALFPNGRAYVFCEWKFNGEHARTKLVAAEVARQIHTYTVDEVYPMARIARITKSVADPSMWNGDGHSGEDYAETFSRNKVPLVPGDHARVLGWGRLRHWFNLAPDNLPWLMIHPGCTTLVRTIPGLIRDKHDPDDIDTSGEDHACLTGDTLVATESGERRLETIAVGDRVWTRDGLRRVDVAAETARTRALWRLETSEGHVVTGTPNHPVWANGEFVRMDTLRCGDTLAAWPRITTAGPDRSGEHWWDRFRAGLTSITRTAIRGITRSRTWSVSLARRISACMRRVDDFALTISSDGMPRLAAGTALSRVVPGIVTMPSRSGRIALPILFAPVSSAERPSRTRLAGADDSVLWPARHDGAGARGWMMRIAAASSAGWSSAATGTNSNSAVPASAVRVCASYPVTTEQDVPVYNLAVAGRHEYYANGLLVSNCDALRYGVMSRPSPKRAMTPERITIPGTPSDVLASLFRKPQRSLGMVS